MPDEIAIVATPESERNLPAEIATARLLVGFRLAPMRSRMMSSKDRAHDPSGNLAAAGVFTA
jgi:hypothetical protein